MLAERGEYDPAAAAFTSSLEVARELDDVVSMGKAMANLGNLAQFRGDLVACAAVAKAMHEGAVEATRYPRNPLDNYSGGQADGRLSDLAVPNPGQFEPYDQPILHGNPYGPSGTEAAPNCQAGQTGYALGEALSPGQGPDNPAFGVRNVGQATGLGPLGRTDLFLTQDGDRIFWDSP